LRETNLPKEKNQQNQNKATVSLSLSLSLTSSPPFSPLKPDQKPSFIRALLGQQMFTSGNVTARVFERQIRTPPPGASVSPQISLSVSISQSQSLFCLSLYLQ